MCVVKTLVSIFFCSAVFLLLFFKIVMTTHIHTFSVSKSEFSE